MQVPPLSPIDSTLWRLVFSICKFILPTLVYPQCSVYVILHDLTLWIYFYQAQVFPTPKAMNCLNWATLAGRCRHSSETALGTLGGSFRNTSWTRKKWYHSKVAFLTVCMHSLQKDAKGKNFQASFLQCSAATTSNHNQQQAQAATTTTAATIAITTTTATSTSTSTSQPEPNPG